MSRQDEIVAAFDRAHSDFMELVRGLTPEQWRTQAVNHPEIRLGPNDERRPVGVIVHHVASSYRALRNRCGAWMRGEDPPMPPPDINERHAAANPEPDRAETTALLEREADEVRRFIRSASDADLEARGQWFRGETTAAQMLGETMPFHVDWHAGSIRASLAGEGQRPAG
jgi:hypothetical protein